MGLYLKELFFTKKYTYFGSGDEQIHVFIAEQLLSAQSYDCANVPYYFHNKLENKRSKNEWTQPTSRQVLFYNAMDKMHLKLRGIIA